MEFPWVLVFDLGISNFKIVAHNFAEFLKVKKLVFSRTSKGNVTNLNFQRGGGQKTIPTTPPPPTGLKFFCNSPIMDRLVSSKKSNYYIKAWQLELLQKKFQTGGGGLKT